jgi:hypothetical protein
MRDANGVSRGSGFVAFKSAEDANRAVSLVCVCIFCSFDLISKLLNHFLVTAY